MIVDYNSLLLAIGFSGAGLSLAFFGTWLTARTDSFLLTWSVGVLLLVCSVFVYRQYALQPDPRLSVLAFAMLLGGLTVVLGAAYQFRGRPAPLLRGLPVLAVAYLLSLPPLAFGYDGLGLMITNLVAAAILGMTAFEYWRGRAEAPTPIVGLSVLYAVAGMSFLLCAVVLIVDGRLIIGRAPANWVEDLSLILSIACIAGIGALSLAINQWRIAGRHRREAFTDPLTGLLNRRALFDTYGDGPIAAHTAVIVFDLDKFKAINDHYGHAAGDRVLSRFAAAMRESIRTDDTAARLGGEEFALVLPRSTPELALLIAERVRAMFSTEIIDSGSGKLQCTVSAGVAFAGPEDSNTLDKLLSRADKALYLAKRGGRNRVASPELRLVS
jgi:diguanylate cyclase (GGDEF)-like protein